MRFSEISMSRGRALPRAWRASPSGFGPARGGGVIVGARLDPAGSISAFLALPERRVGFQIIHQELRRLKRRLSMLGSRQHQHDIFAGLNAADAMDDGKPGQRPARARGFGMARN